MFPVCVSTRALLSDLLITSSTQFLTQNTKNKQWIFESIMHWATKLDGQLFFDDLLTSMLPNTWGRAKLSGLTETIDHQQNSSESLVNVDRTRSLRSFDYYSGVALHGQVQREKTENEFSPFCCHIPTGIARKDEDDLSQGSTAV